MVVDIDVSNVGLDLAAVGSAISIVGVLLNNVFHEFRWAMFVWCFSNILLTTYFLGLWGGMED